MGDGFQPEGVVESPALRSMSSPKFNAALTERFVGCYLINSC
jgi:hypothetical protein